MQFQYAAPAAAARETLGDGVAWGSELIDRSRTVYTMSSFTTWNFFTRFELFGLRACGLGQNADAQNAPAYNVPSMQTDAPASVNRFYYNYETTDSAASCTISRRRLRFLENAPDAPSTSWQRAAAPPSGLVC